jgi:hypothetical protein
VGAITPDMSLQISSIVLGDELMQKRKQSELTSLDKKENTQKHHHVTDNKDLETLKSSMNGFQKNKKSRPQ